jgi:nucleotide-binding universal stress UspA family protein
MLIRRRPTPLNSREEGAAELIVLGSRGRSPVTSLVLGSVSYGVVNNSELPVLIIPPGRPEARRV